MEPQLATALDATLIPCPSTSEYTGGGAVGLLGGLVSLAGNVVLVPAQAILGPTEISIEVPPSSYMLIELTVNGQDHWQFQEPVTVTIDYSRCNVGLLDPPVSVWHVDPATGEMLAPMGGFDNRLFHRVTFKTDHFSGYAIAN